MILGRRKARSRSYLKSNPDYPSIFVTAARWLTPKRTSEQSSIIHVLWSLESGVWVFQDFFAYYFGGKEARPAEIQAWIGPPLQGQKVKTSGLNFPLSARANSGRDMVACCQEFGHEKSELWTKEFVNEIWPVFLIRNDTKGNKLEFIAFHLCIQQ